MRLEPVGIERVLQRSALVQSRDGVPSGPQSATAHPSGVILVLSLCSETSVD